jgi:hypothetical protein
MHFLIGALGRSLLEACNIFNVHSLAIIGFAIAPYPPTSFALLVSFSRDCEPPHIGSAATVLSSSCTPRDGVLRNANVRESDVDQDHLRGHCGGHPYRHRVHHVRGPARADSRAVVLQIRHRRAGQLTHRVPIARLAMIQTGLHREMRHAKDKGTAARRVGSRDRMSRRDELERNGRIIHARLRGA